MENKNKRYLITFILAIILYLVKSLIFNIFFVLAISYVIYIFLNSEIKNDEQKFSKVNRTLELVFIILGVYLVWISLVDKNSIYNISGTYVNGKIDLVIEKAASILSF
jgi:hypothetical protein